MWITYSYNGSTTLHIQEYGCIIYIIMDSDNHLENKTNDKPWLWKKGQSGNLKGRPKGVTMKEYAKDYISRMTDEERDEFMDGIPKEIIWKMSEGNPANATDLTTLGGKIEGVVILPTKNESTNNTLESTTEAGTSLEV